jgi:hypothetical protein
VNHGGVDILAKAMHDMDVQDGMSWDDNKPWQKTVYREIASELIERMRDHGGEIVKVTGSKESWWQMLWGKG